MREKQKLGWKEWCRFPRLDIPAIKAKIDTGAKTSALHAFNISTFEVDGRRWVRFKVHPVQRKRKPEFECHLPLIEMKEVRSSNGLSEMRYVVETEVALGAQGKAFKTRMTLTNRDAMGFRMLVGRNTLKRYLVDPAASYLLGQPDPDNC